MIEYRMFDTSRADGCTVDFERVDSIDRDATPSDYLFQDSDYAEQDTARLAAWQAGEWYFIGIVARATITLIRNGVGTRYMLESAGLWAIESDSSAEYLDEVYREECESLRADMQAIGATLVGEC